MDIKNGCHIKSQSLKINIDFQIFQWLNKSIPVLIGIYIFFNPFPHTTAVKEICFYLSVVILFSLIIFRKNQFSFKTPFMLSFGLFVCWVFIGLFFAIDKKNSIHDFYSHLIRYIVLYYLLINFFNSKKRLIDLSWIIIISATLFSIGALFYFYIMLGYSLLERLGVGIFVQMPINVIAIVTVTSTIICLNHLLFENQLYRRVILTICIFTMFATAVLTQTRSSYIPLFLATIVLLSKQKKNIFVLVCAMWIIVAITPLKHRIISYSLKEDLRIGIIYQSFEVIKDYPIMGIGFGMETFKNALDLKKYHERVPEKYREVIIYDDPHNIFLGIAVRLGVVGLVLFFYIIFVFFKMCWEIIKYGKDDFSKNWGRCLAAVFFSFLFIGYFHPLFSHMPETIFCAMFSMLTIVRRLNNEQLSKDVA